MSKEKIDSLKCLGYFTQTTIIDTFKKSKTCTCGNIVPFHLKLNTLYK